MRQKIYNLLVNKQSGISYRYHKMHDGSTGARKISSWVYLFWLNFAYYILFQRRLGCMPSMEIYEQKCLVIETSESKEHLQQTNLSVDSFVEVLKDYDVVSFDIFDTLIFRSLALPTDVFYFIGEELGYANFKNLRMWSEGEARDRSKEEYGHTEINLADIWKILSEKINCTVQKGCELEQKYEQIFCYANPFMKEVFTRLAAMGKKIIIVSDMYLPKSCIEKILEDAGYKGYEKLYLSNEYQKNKAGGNLYELIKQEVTGSIIHVGDNPHSDDEMARRHGIATKPYPNVNNKTQLYRAMDLSYMIGSAYRGLVNAQLFNGRDSYEVEYEYGYVYGGLFVVGYCAFIHEYAKTHNLDKVLFLSRDGDILMQVYQMLYPDESVEYVYWSRKAALKLMADEDRFDYFRRFIHHKVNQGITFAEILSSMELEELGASLEFEEKLTSNNAKTLQRFIEAKWDEVIAIYEGQMTAARKYYAKVLAGCQKVAAVDIGWAGSGALALSHLISDVWKMDCELTGLIAGTNTLHNAEPDASEPFLQSGKLVAYLYSQSHNRELMKKHNPNKDYNVYWELLLSSPTPQFAGFYEGACNLNQDKNKYLRDLDISLVFGKYDYNLDGIRLIQQGILDFASHYKKHFADIPYMLRISGRDAYAPMLVAASHNERYLKMIEKRFDLEINVN
ncbi:HAD family hydrolase [Eubacterium oxidoreducens]|uniref:Haloacid dehalogenase-like hydrolase n=1 Tax=Eubacterium oxidoreducens TaxID=1732 RepID=A0A1G6CBT8_EUBOX|nr:hypothetical protein [Eubacterium oxidoreducens]SDB30261.1 hypothetical protein SAMN02910417_02265 [Eubacterium oxidoreducens]